ncbi:MAG: cell division protein FtsQ/DivIB [Patescibacteria group bacterium]
MTINNYTNPSYRSKIKIKKDYQKKEFVNPYFNDQKNRGFNTGYYLKIIAVCFIVYIIVYSDLFKIKKIEIEGADFIKPEELRQTVENQLASWRWYILPQKNLLFLSKKRLEEGIVAKYRLNKLEIDKGWQSLKIKIEEKISNLIIYNKKTFYFADSDGVITSEISQDKVGEYWTRFPIFNVANENINIGEQIIDTQKMDFILKLNEELKNTLVKIAGYESNDREEVTLVSKDGWRAYFDLNSDIKKSVENLALVLKEKIHNPRLLEYIDLRFGDKVYYR